MVHELHAAHRDVGLVMSVCAALEIPLMLMTGALSKKISNHALIMMGCGAAFLYYLILSASTHSWPAHCSAIASGNVCGDCYGQWNQLLHGAAASFAGNRRHHLFQRRHDRKTGRDSGRRFPCPICRVSSCV